MQLHWFIWWVTNFIMFQIHNALLSHTRCSQMSYYWDKNLPYPTRRRILLKLLIPCRVHLRFWEHQKRGRQGVNFLSLIDTTTKDHQFGVRSVWEGRGHRKQSQTLKVKGFIQNWWNSWSNGFKVWEHLKINYVELNKSVSQMIFELDSRKDY